MSAGRDEIAVSGFAFLAMTMRASVESFVKICRKSFDSTNSAYKPCSHRRDAEKKRVFHHRDTEDTEKDKRHFLGKDKDKRRRRTRRRKKRIYVWEKQKRRKEER